MSEFDFGFSSLTENDLTDKKYTEEIRLLKSKLEEKRLALVRLSKMYEPLLNNLKKNPENELIKWPNRKAVIEDFERKINDFLDKEQSF